ncbi:unnamed protein product [Strongylus vulgaris]|uniref:Uncharacterized protein n=1 Tax=Strongylus vulgaris TaxID=40348 RepID=A0A3P7J6B0_STRVU|nr:unnamed protein product [Strongylus vulgaris]
MLASLLAAFLILHIHAHAPSAVIIPAHQFVAPRYVAIGGSGVRQANIYSPVWPRMITAANADVMYGSQEIADFLGIPAFYWMILFFISVIVTAVGLLSLIVFFIRRQQESLKRVEQRRYKAYCMPL